MKTTNVNMLMTRRSCVAMNGCGLYLISILRCASLSSLVALGGCAQSDDAATPDYSRWINELDRCYQRAILYEQDADYALAEKEYTKMINSSPSFVRSELYRGRALARAGMGHHMEAVTDYKRILEWNPSDAEAHFSIASIYVYVKKYALAIEHIDQAIALETESCQLSLDLMGQQRKNYLRIAQGLGPERGAGDMQGPEKGPEKGPG